MVENTSQRLTIIEARDLGLEPCKICKPEDHGGVTNPQKKSQGENKVKHQCIGKTKAGYRCKHLTKIANSYCYQHSPKE